MKETADLVLAILGAILVWTTSVIGGMIWLNGKFRSIEQTVYKEATRLRHEFDVKHYSLNTRIMRLEMKGFGYSGGNGGPVTPDDGESFP
jgi:hypothetical protein